jgi:hypothetical protein
VAWITDKTEPKRGDTSKWWRNTSAASTFWRCYARVEMELSTNVLSRIDWDRKDVLKCSRSMTA